MTSDQELAGLGYENGRQGLVGASGGISMMAGIVMQFLPVLTRSVLARVAAILLIPIGIAVLTTIPRSDSNGGRQLELTRLLLQSVVDRAKPRFLLGIFGRRWLLQPQKLNPTALVSARGSSRGAPKTYAAVTSDAQ
jgi:hypothetical protein